MLDTYSEFIRTKLAVHPPAGIANPTVSVGRLFPFQRALALWALRRGRAAVFASTGLGKTSIQLAWADAVTRHAGGPVMILAPLAVAEQTADEGAACGVGVRVCRAQSDVTPGVNVTNYDRLHLFDPAIFAGVVLDESSIIKHHDAKTLRALMDAFGRTPFKLCATATPAPNDWTELGTHAEFLGVCTRAEMLAEFFVHDGGETQVWRLKGHARAAFWRWVASWAALVRHPRDLGFDADGYDLPPLEVVHRVVGVDRNTLREAGLLFAEEASSLMERRTARRSSVAARVAACAEDVAREPGEPWVIWCDLNAEADALREAISGAVEVRGTDDPDEKAAKLRDFAAGKIRVLITKPKIAGFGLNWQHCARVAFVGVTDSWESYFQSVRRSWRFGQRRKVVVRVYASEAEGAVVANLRRKEEDSERMAAALSEESSAAVRAEVVGAVRTVNVYEPGQAIRLPAWLKTEAA